MRRSLSRSSRRRRELLDRLKRGRTLLGEGWTFDEAAEEVGVSDRTLRSWMERERRKEEADTLLGHLLLGLGEWFWFLFPR